MPKGSKTRVKRVPKRKMTVDKKQTKEINKLKKRVGTPEVKYTDTNLTGGANFSTAGTLIALNYLAQGNQPFNRIGNQIRNIAVNIKGYFVLGSGNSSDRIVRVQLLWDKIGSSTPLLYGATTGGVAAVNDNGATATFVPNIFAPVSVEYRDRFKILYDKLFTIHIQTTASAVEIPFQIYKKLGRLTRFNAITGSVAATVTNLLYLSFSVDNVGTTAPQYNFNSRVFYTDD